MEKAEQTGISKDPGNNSGEIDFDKLISVLRKSVPWIGLIFFVVTVSAYLIFIRWQKPVYEAVSDLKLDIKTESTLFGIENPTPNLNSISAEIELMTSRYFFSRVIDELDYDVSYYYYGKVLVEERYKNSPFRVDFEMANDRYKDKKFDVEILGDNQFALEAPGYPRNSYEFGEHIFLDDLLLSIEKTRHFSNESEGNYYFSINSKEALINYFSDNFDAAPLNISGKSIQVSLKDHSRQKAQEFLTAIDTLYFNYTQEEKNKATRLQIAFLDEQLEQTQRKLEEYENYFENFTLKNKTVNLNEEMGETILKMEELEHEKFEMESQLVAIDVFLKELGKDQPIVTNAFQDQGLPPELVVSVKELSEAIKEKQILLGSHKENTFVIEKQNNKIEILKSRLKGLVDGVKKDLEEGIALINRKEKEIQKNFKTLPSLGTEYTKNQRNYKLYEGFYLSQLQTKAEFEIAQAGTVPDFAILTPPQVSNEPIYPKPLYVYGAALIVGFVFSFIFVGIRYLLHNKIGSLKELESLVHAPVLGIVPVFKAEKMPITKLVVDRHPKSPISEALRSIRTNMEFVNAEKEKKIITVTSTVSGEGKTFVSVNLGAIIAMSSQKVVLLDLDMRKPKVNQAFEDKLENKGLSTILIKKHNLESCIRSTSIPNLDYVQAGPTPPNPSELLLGSAFDEMLAELRKRYDLIIMDTPPVGLVTDAVLLMKKADLPLYILRSNYSKRSFANIIDRLRTVNNFTNLTLIFNALAESQSQGYGYGVGYSNYYEEAKPKTGRFKFLTNIFNF